MRLSGAGVVSCSFTLELGVDAGVMAALAPHAESAAAESRRASGRTRRSLEG
jgi:hypothetical protein